MEAGVFPSSTGIWIVEASGLLLIVLLLPATSVGVALAGVRTAAGGSVGCSGIARPTAAAGLCISIVLPLDITVGEHRIGFINLLEFGFVTFGDIGMILLGQCSKGLLNVLLRCCAAHP